MQRYLERGWARGIIQLLGCIFLEYFFFNVICGFALFGEGDPSQGSWGKIVTAPPRTGPQPHMP